MAVPSNIQVPSAVPTNIASVVQQLTDITVHLQQWIALVANEFAAIELRLAALENPNSSESNPD